MTFNLNGDPDSVASIIRAVPRDWKHVDGCLTLVRASTGELYKAAYFSDRTREWNGFGGEILRAERLVKEGYVGDLTFMKKVCKLPGDQVTPASFCKFEIRTCDTASLLKFVWHTEFGGSPSDFRDILQVCYNHNPPVIRGDVQIRAD